MKILKSGNIAEKKVADYLEKSGHKIVAINWKNRFCEIDIVSKLNGIVYFTEVKYRTSSSHGEGLDYITPRKLKQMNYAAQNWMQESKWDGECRLLAVEVGGTDYKVSLPIEI